MLLRKLERESRPEAVLTRPATLLAAALATLLAWSGGLQAQNDSPGRLDTVVVSATRVEDRLRDLPISPLVIDEKTINRRPNVDLGDLLEDAGILVDRQYYLGGQAVLRGLSGNISGTDVQSDVLMLLNGHRIGLASMLRFPAKNIERVEVLRGPAALQYGSAAMGGVVNVVTKRGAGPFSAFAETGLGSFGHYDAAVGFSGRTGDWDYSAAFSYLEQTDDYVTGQDQRYLGTTTDGRTEVSVQLGRTFQERHRVGLIFNHLDLDKYGFTGSIQDMNNVSAMTREANYLARTAGTSNFLDLSYDGGTESGRFAWQVKGFVGRDEQFGRTVNNSHNNDVQGAQARLTGRFDEVAAEVTLGFDWTEYDFDTASANLSEYLYTDLGGYLMAKKTFLDGRLVVTGGARLNHVKSETAVRGGHVFSETKVTPALGGSFMLADWFKLRANYAQGYRAPSLNELYGSGSTMVGRITAASNSNSVYQNVWLTPNLDLRPQQSDSFELGADVDLENFTGSLTVFYSIFKNKIERFDTPYPNLPAEKAAAAAIYPSLARMPDTMYNAFRGRPLGFPDPNTFMPPYVAWAQYVNFGDARMAGLELFAKWDLGHTLGWGPSLSPYFSGTWLPTAKYVSGPDDGLRMRKTPKFFASYGLEFEALDQGLWVDLNLLTKSKQRTTNLTSDPNVQDPQPGWTVVNLRAEKTLVELERAGRLSIQLEFSNIFDEYYESYPSYPLPGRGFYLGLRWDYD
ncbi:MAG: TonB-dependent receptor [Deltaproteobacteria bacterium]|jgi:vitamin B12 transporter|nr:TonB-dependent receptor [Deltaproteobacteria bacterium]